MLIPDEDHKNIVKLLGLTVMKIAEGDIGSLPYRGAHRVVCR